MPAAPPDAHPRAGHSPQAAAEEVLAGALLQVLQAPAGVGLADLGQEIWGLPRGAMDAHPHPTVHRSCIPPTIPAGRWVPPGCPERGDAALWPARDPHRCHCSHPILIPSCSVCLGWKSPPATHLLLEEPADDLFPHLLPLLIRGELVVRLGCPGRGRCCRQRYRARLCPVPPTEPPASPNEIRLPRPWGEGSVCTHATGSCLYWGGGVPPLLPPAGRGAGCQTQACCSPGSFTYSKGGRKRPARALRAGTSRDRFTGTCFPLAAPRAVRSLHTGEAPAAPPYVPGPPWKTNPAVQGTHPLLTQTVQ